MPIDALAAVLLGGAGYLVVTAKPQETSGPSEGSTKTGLPYARIAAITGARVAVSRQSTGSFGQWDGNHAEPPPGTDSFPQEVKDFIIAKMKEKWDKLSADAKTKACEKMADTEVGKALKAQGVTCESSGFEVIAKAALSALGAQGFGAIGGFLAEYCFGEKLEGYLNEAWESVKGWAEDAYDEAEAAAEDWVNDL